MPARSGTLRFAAAEVGARPDAHFRQRAQVVFQNSDTSLNPRQTVGVILGRAVRWFAIASIESEVAAEIDRLLDLVRLPRAYAQRYPHQLSGGEKQRVGIARALASRPWFLVCDEAVSALDVSVQAAVLNLLRDLRDELGVTYLFISHDIGVIAHIADRVAVMYQGTIVEEGPVGDVLHPPYHPYTELLLSSVPLIGKRRGAASMQAARSAPAAGGCKFANRCARRVGSVCDSIPPPLHRPARTTPFVAISPCRSLPRCRIGSADSVCSRSVPMMKFLSRSPTWSAAISAAGVTRMPSLNQ